MSTDDQQRWDEKHYQELGLETAASFLREVLSLSSWEIHAGKALDIATGKGRNAIFLAQKGFDVEGVDISQVALEEGRRRAGKLGVSVNFRQADLEEIALPEGVYDLVVNINYLQRSLVPQIKKALKPGGHVVFDTYLIDQQALGHPRNPAYLLTHNELLDLFRDFRVLCYREGKFAGEGKASYRASLFARKDR
jgi:2-polyprenyl-3-methyl-5-hydroxy-6-metoxy-1,4-benzoquinol methylase